MFIRDIQSKHIFIDVFFSFLRCLVSVQLFGVYRLFLKLYLVYHKRTYKHKITHISTWTLFTKFTFFFTQKAHLLCGPIIRTSSALVDRGLAQMARRLLAEQLLHFSVAKTSRPSLPCIYVPALGPLYKTWRSDILHLSSFQVIVVLVQSKLSPFYWSFCDFQVYRSIGVSLGF